MKAYWVSWTARVTGRTLVSAESEEQAREIIEERLAERLPSNGDWGVTGTEIELADED